MELEPGQFFCSIIGRGKVEHRLFWGAVYLVGSCGGKECFFQHFFLSRCVYGVVSSPLICVSVPSLEFSSVRFLPV